MKVDDVRREILKQVVADQDTMFWTKDVSMDTRMDEAHRALVGNGSYHSVVGRALSRYEVDLGIVKVPEGEDKGGKGMMWQKR